MAKSPQKEQQQRFTLTATSNLQPGGSVSLSLEFDPPIDRDNDRDNQANRFAGFIMDKIIEWQKGK